MPKNEEIGKNKNSGDVTYRNTGTVVHLKRQRHDVLVLTFFTHDKYEGTGTVFNILITPSSAQL